MKKILLVEDEFLIAAGEKSELERYGYEVSHVSSGAEAVNVAAKSYDIILMDINLGNGIDGIEASTEILKTVNIPIIFLSSHVEKDIIEKTEKVTFFGYVTKNSGITVLDASIKMAFKLFESHTNLKKKTEWHESIINTAMDGLIECDMNGNVLDVNETYCNMSGYSRKELLSMKVSDLDYHYSNLDVINEINNIVDIGSDRFESVHLRKNNEKYNVELSVRYLEGKIICFVRDITSIKKWDEIYDILPVGVSISKKGVIIEQNKRLAEILEMSEQEIKEKKFRDRVCFDSDGIKMAEGDFPTTIVKNTRKLIKHKEIQIERKDGTFKWIDVSCKPIFEDGTATIISDITDRKIAENKLIESEAKYRSLAENSDDIIFITNGMGEYKFVNKVFSSFFHKAPEEIIGKTFWDIYPKAAADHRLKIIEEVLSNRQNKTFEISVSCDNKILWYYSTASVIENDNVLVKGMDITEKKLAEEKIESLLKEKELLLREVHHRVKNNMNTIVSLLSIQASENEKISGALDDAIRRVQCQTVLYDKLYRVPISRNVSALEYFPTLIDEIISGFNTENINIISEIEDFDIDQIYIQPISLIFNEIITNSMKYAFAGRENGEISISIKKDEIKISDNGIGINSSKSGFGMTLIKALVEQVKGTLSVEDNNGTLYTIKMDSD